jgi:hypothetical protein
LSLFFSSFLNITAVKSQTRMCMCILCGFLIPRNAKDKREKTAYPKKKTLFSSFFFLCPLPMILCYAYGCRIHCARSY